MDKQIVIVPIYQVLRDPSEPGAPANNLTFFLGVTFKKQNMVVIKWIPQGEWKKYIGYWIAIILSFLITTYLVY